LLQTWLYQEALVAISLGARLTDRIQYYVTTRGSLVDLVLTIRERSYGIKLLSEETINTRELLVLSALSDRSSRQIRPIALGAVRARVDGTEIFPWEVVA